MELNDSEFYNIIYELENLETYRVYYKKNVKP